MIAQHIDINQEELLLEEQRTLHQENRGVQEVYISSDNQSNSISIHLNLNQMQQTALQGLQLQNRQLRLENDHLRAANQDLMLKLGHQNEERKLKEILRNKEKEIENLKNKIQQYKNHSSQEQISQKQQQSSKSRPNSKKQIEKQMEKDLNLLIHDVQVGSQVKTQKQQYFQFSKDSYRQKVHLIKQIQTLRTTIQQMQAQLRWSLTLSKKIINMGVRLSFLFKQQLFQGSSSLKKQAKLSWRYIKHVLGYILIDE